MTLREYFKTNAARRYRARDWDCSKFTLGWVATFAPKTARAVAQLAIKAGYNEVSVGDDDGLRKVQLAFGATAERFAGFINHALPDLVELPLRPQPGDIAVRDGDLACGIVDEDYHAVFLSERGGYERRASGPGDAFLRARG